MRLAAARSRRAGARAVVAAGLTGLLAAAAALIALNTAHAAPVRYEAENASCDGTVDSDHSGFSGSGFCNTPNTTGTAVQFTVDAASAGTATLGIRYANGSSGNVAPNGSENASGTESDPTTLTSAITRIEPGGRIYMRGGTYNLSQTVHIGPGNDGTSGNRTELFAFTGETPVLNFSAQSEDSANRGLAIGGDWWHIYGIIVEQAGDNGILLGGNNNVVERVETRFNHDTGLQLSRYTAGAPQDQWPSNNLVLSSGARTSESTMSSGATSPSTTASTGSPTTATSAR